MLATDVIYEVKRGSLFELTLKLPAPDKLWRVESVDFEPKDAVRFWATTGSLLVVELRRGLTPRTPGKLSVRLVHHAEDSIATARLLDVPTLVPMPLGTSNGTLAVSLDADCQAALQETSVPLVAAPAAGPWRVQGRMAPLYYLPWRGQPVAGKLKLYPGMNSNKTGLAPGSNGPNDKASRGRMAESPDLVRAPSGVLCRMRCRPCCCSTPPLRSITRRSNSCCRRSPHAWCGHAHLEVFVQPDRPILNHFRFDAVNWRSPDLLVRMPAQAKKILGAQIDGHWLDQVPQEQIELTWQARLPAFMDLKRHTYDLYYSSDVDWPSSPIYGDLDAPAPGLPGDALAFERTWWLAPGLTPLDTRELLARTDPVVGGLLRRAWHSGDAALAGLFPIGGDDSLDLQRQVLLGAEAGLRRKLAKSVSLAEALDRLARDFLKGQLGLVLDRGAMVSADVRADALVVPAHATRQSAGRPFWEGLGLVYVPCSSGPLLTTRATRDLATNPWLKRGDSTCH